jgi:DNA-binding CsgD family transcriptional regulator
MSVIQTAFTTNRFVVSTAIATEASVSTNLDDSVILADYLWQRIVGSPPLPASEISRLSGLSLSRTTRILESHPEVFVPAGVKAQTWMAIEAGPEIPSKRRDNLLRNPLERVSSILDHKLTELWFTLNFTRRLRAEIREVEDELAPATVGDLLAGALERDPIGGRGIVVHLELLVRNGTYINPTSLVRAAMHGKWEELKQGGLLSRLSTAKRDRLERSLDMVVMRAAGMSLQEIGAHFGVTRERVRQLLLDFTDVIDEQRENVLVSKAEENQRRVLEVLSARPGLTKSELEESLDSTWEQISKDVPRRWAKFIGSEARVGNPRWSREQILAAIRRAARVEEPLSRKTFDLLVKERVVDCCSTVRIAQVFGKWSTACELAGVESVSSWIDEYERSWTEDDCIQWMCEFLLSEGSSRSVGSYDQWAKTQDGQPPSSGTIRGIAGQWSLVTNRALLALRWDEYATWHREAMEADLKQHQSKMAAT